MSHALSRERDGCLPVRRACWHFGDATLAQGSVGDVEALIPRPVAPCCRIILVRVAAGAGPAWRLQLSHGPRHAGVPADAEALLLVLPLVAPPGSPALATIDAAAAGGGLELDLGSGSGALLAGFLWLLARDLPHIPPTRAEGLAVALRCLVVACLPAGSKSGSGARTLPTRRLERARALVREHMASPEFGPDKLARLMAMSRSKLYRLLGEAGGVAHLINRERLLEARRRLVAPGEPQSIHAIASDVGFLDHSTFSRAFRREFGCSPSEARDHGAAGPAVIAPLPERIRGRAVDWGHGAGFAEHDAGVLAALAASG